MGIKKKLLAGATGGIAYLLWAWKAAIVFAASPSPESITITRPTVGGKLAGPENISDVINNLVTLAFIVAVILVFFFLIFGGIKWIVSGGDQKKTEEARNMLTAAVVGLAIVALAWAIIQVLETFFSIEIVGGELQLPGTPPASPTPVPGR